MTQYIAYGLSVQSAVKLPSAVFHQALASDITVSFGINSISDTPVKIDAPYTLLNDHVLFSMPTGETYACSQQSVVIDRGVNKTGEGIQGMLAATALPVVLWLRGDIVLHAAGMLLSGQPSGLAIAGASGSGKSTLLRQLMSESGSSVVGDDTLRLTVIDEQLMMSGLPQVIHYRDTPSCTLEARQMHPVKPENTLGTAPLHSLFILGSRTTGEANFTKLNGTCATMALMQQIHRPKIVNLLNAAPASFNALMTWQILLDKMRWISEHVSVYLWQRRQDETALSDFERDMLRTLMIRK